MDTTRSSKESSVEAHASMKRSLSIAAAIMTGSVLLSRVMGLVREQVLAFRAGTDPEMDAYVAAFLLPELVNHVLAGGFLSVTFIPIYQKYIASGNTRRANEVLSNLLTVGTVIVAGVTILFILFTDDILRLTESIKVLLGLSEEVQRSTEWVRLTVHLTRIVLPAQIFFYWGSFFMAVQYAHKKFFLPALMPLCYNAGIILGGLVLYPYIGIEGFSWGVLVGALVGGVIVQLPGAMKLGARYRITWKPNDPDLKKYVLLSLPFILGLSVTFSNEFLFRFFGLFLSQGAISYLNYALRVTMILVGVFGMSFSAASFPFLSELASEGKMKELGRLSNGIIIRTSAVIMPVSAIMVVLAYPIIAVLFQRGEFNQASTAATAPVLRMYLIGAPAFAFSMVLMRSFYAVQNTLLPMIISSISIALSLPVYWVLGRWLGPQGIGLSSTVAMLWQFLVLYIAWVRRYRATEETGLLLIRVIQTLGVAVASGFVCLGAMLAWQRTGPETGNDFLDNTLVLLVAGIPALVVAVTLLHMLGIQRLGEIRRMLLKK